VETNIGCISIEKWHCLSTKDPFDLLPDSSFIGSLIFEGIIVIFTS